MRSLLLISFLCLGFINYAQNNKSFQLQSPDGKIVIHVNTGTFTEWQVKHEEDVVIAPSVVSITLDNGEVLGTNTIISSTKYSSENNNFITPFYKKSSVKDEYNQLVITFKKGYGIVFRAYNDGAAYRFFSSRKGTITINNEQAEFKFDKNARAFTPYVHDVRNGERFMNSFESLYDKHSIADFAKDTLAFLPVLVELDHNKKAVISEADLENYPGMFLAYNSGSKPGYKGVFAPYPTAEKLVGIEYMVTERANYIARVDGAYAFPWRFVVVSTNDKDLANNDMVQKLAAHQKLDDVSWIKPGKVAWDWWNDWNVTHVDFHAGINTPTYKYYIDFAAANHLEYIIMDEGWSDDADLMKVNPNIDLKEIIDYGKQKGVGVILWATWYAVRQKMEDAFAYYSKIGVKGFKVDFFDRDDQIAVASTYEIAKSAAYHKLLVDYHGMFKPTGLQRIYPNVIGFEGVRGMENVKWAPNDNVPEYDATLPFIRMIAGPMDYTPGAMRNATKSAFRPVNSMPMSQGTRCHQIAMYTVFEAPLNMLSDNPTAYMKEQESTDFISRIPTIFDETVALNGQVAEYITIARRKENVWYIGSLGNWDTHDIDIDLSFLSQGNYKAVIFQDGMNADRDATDYKKSVINVTSKDKLSIHLAPGGGWAAIIEPM